MKWLERYVSPGAARAFVFFAISRGPYFLVVSSFFQPWLVDSARFNADPDTGTVSWLGLSIQPSSYVAIINTVFDLMVALTSPFLGALADASPHRRRYLIAVWAIGSSTATLIFLSIFSWQVAGILLAISFVFLDFSIMFSNSYITEVGSSDESRGKVTVAANACSLLFQVLFVATFTGLSLIPALHRESLKLQNSGFEQAISGSKGYDWQSALVSPSSPSQLSYNESAFCGLNSTLCFTEKTSGSNSGSKALRFTTNASQEARLYQTVLTDSSTSGFDVLGSSYVKNQGSQDISVTMYFFDGRDSTQSTLVVPPDDDFHYISVRQKISSPPDQFSLGLMIPVSSNLVIDDVQVTSSPSVFPPIVTAISGAFFLLLGAYSMKQFPQSHGAGFVGHWTSFVFHSVRNLLTSVKTTFSDRDMICFLLSQGLGAAAGSAWLAILPVVFADVLDLSAATIGAVFITALLLSIAGGFLFDKLAKRISYSRALLVGHGLYIVGTIAVVMMIAFPSAVYLIWPLAALIGFALGAAFTLTTVVYSSMIPPGKEVEYFGILTFFWKSFSWAGPLIFAIINEQSGRLNVAVLSIGGIFVLVFLFQMMVRPRKEPSRVIVPVSPGAVCIDEQQFEHEEAEVAPICVSPRPIPEANAEA